MNNRERVMCKLSAKRLGPSDYLSDIDAINAENESSRNLLLGQMIVGTGLGTALGAGIGKATGKAKYPELGGMVGGVLGAVAMLLLVGKGQEAGLAAARNDDARYHSNTWKQLINPYALAKNEALGRVAGDEHLGNALWNMDNSFFALEHAHNKAGIPLTGKEWRDAATSIDSLYENYDASKAPERGRLEQSLQKINKAWDALEHIVKNKAPRKFNMVQKERSFADKWTY